ncbi:MAG: hypothetical protein ACREIC_05770 [Limisphaerales bacterium]
MNSKQISMLVVRLGPDSPFFSMIMGGRVGRRPLSLARRVQIATTDPALLGHISQSYALARIPLPEFSWPAAVLRAYDFFSSSNGEDKDLVIAYELQGPEREFERSVIRALLLCPEATDAQIAEVFALRPEVVALFESLWWRVRDRARDHLFLAQILSGRDSVAEAEHVGEAAEWALRLLRRGRTTGSAQEVLMEARLLSPAPGIPEKKLLETILRKFLEGVLADQQKGQFDKRELKLLEKYLADSDLEPAWEDPFLLISQDKEAQATVQQMVRQHIASLLIGEEEHRATAVDFEI